MFSLEFRAPGTIFLNILEPYILRISNLFEDFVEIGYGYI